MAFPNEKKLEVIRKKLEKAEGTLMLPEKATPLEKFRWDLRLFWKDADGF
jgi:hypothetical protein